MATKTFTFDPDANVAYSANFSITGGSNFIANFVVQDTSNSAFNFTTGYGATAGAGVDWTGSAQMQKSAGTGATTVPAATFTVGFTSAYDGKLRISLGSTSTDALAEGRYEYNVLVGSGYTNFNLVQGNILVYAGIASLPPAV